MNYLKYQFDLVSSTCENRPSKTPGHPKAGSATLPRLPSLPVLAASHCCSCLTLCAGPCLSLIYVPQSYPCHSHLWRTRMHTHTRTHAHSRLPSPCGHVLTLETVLQPFPGSFLSPRRLGAPLPTPSAHSIVCVPWPGNTPLMWKNVLTSQAGSRVTPVHVTQSSHSVEWRKRCPKPN